VCPRPVLLLNYVATPLELTVPVPIGVAPSTKLNRSGWRADRRTYRRRQRDEFLHQHRVRVVRSNVMPGVILVTVSCAVAENVASVAV